MVSHANWSDEQWAKYFGVGVTDIPRIRETVNKYFASAIIKDRTTKQHVVAIYNYDILPSGAKRTFSTVTSVDSFTKFEDAVKFANEKFLPDIQLSELWSHILKIPTRALQMLSVKER